MKVCLMTCMSRVGLPEVSKLRDMLPKETVTYVDEEERGPAWNAERIILDCQNAQDGILIIQDDVIIEPWFMDQVYASQISDEPMTYHNPKPKVVDWFRQGYSYAKVWQIWGQANYYPQWLLKGYAEWMKIVPPVTQKEAGICVKLPRQPESFIYRKWFCDDSSMAACLMWLDRRAYLTLPNLCQHDVGMKSTVRDITDAKFQSKIFGKDLLRVWDRERIFDESFYSTMKLYVHPTQADRYRIYEPQNKGDSD